MVKWSAVFQGLLRRIPRRFVSRVSVPAATLNNGPFVEQARDGAGAP